MLPVSVGSELVDGIRHLLSRGAFQPEGYSEAQIWQKYAGCVPSELPDGVALGDDVYMTVLRKACSTNRYLDTLCGGGELADAAASADFGI